MYKCFWCCLYKRVVRWEYNPQSLVKHKHLHNRCLINLFIYWRFVGISGSYFIQNSKPDWWCSDALDSTNIDPKCILNAVLEENHKVTTYHRILHVVNSHLIWRLYQCPCCQPNPWFSILPNKPKTETYFQIPCIVPSWYISSYAQRKHSDAWYHDKNMLFSGLNSFSL